MAGSPNKDVTFQSCVINGLSLKHNQPNPYLPHLSIFHILKYKLKKNDRQQIAFIIVKERFKPAFW